MNLKQSEKIVSSRSGKTSVKDIGYIEAVTRIDEYARELKDAFYTVMIGTQSSIENGTRKVDEYGNILVKKGSTWHQDYDIFRELAVSEMYHRHGIYVFDSMRE